MKRILLLIIILNILSGCDNILDKYPLDEITEETYWKSDVDLELYINQFYPAFRGSGNFQNLDQDSDNLKSITPSERLNGTWSIPTSDGGWNWDNIRRINYFISNAEKVTVGNIELLEHFKGEGYFFRAYFYFELLKRFGSIPWIDQVLNIDSEELYSNRLPRNLIIDKIINDLNLAVELLSVKDQISSNRINKESAILFKSRVCLYEGTFEKYHEHTDFGVEGSNGQKYIQMAADAAEQLIEEGNLDLYSTNNPEDDYWRLFSKKDLTNVKEAILVESVSPNLELGNWNWRYFNGTSGRGTGITKSLVDSYLDVEGFPISISNLYSGDTTLLQVVDNRDPRLKNTIWIPGQVQIDGNPQLIFEYPVLNLTGLNDLTTTGYMIRKGSTTDPEQNTGSSSDNYGAVDAMVFRYAEALLNYAEAKAELKIITQSDLDISINLLRRRVGMPDLILNVGYTDPQWSFSNVSPIINEIRRERRIELALEGFRTDDIVRWAAADEIIQGRRWKGVRIIEGKSYPEIDTEIKGIQIDEEKYVDRYRTLLPNGFGFDSKRDYLYPIPISELTLNPELTQNPGW